MIDKLREYIDQLFAEAPPTKKAVEVKEEILQNLREKYNDLIADGKGEEAAFNIAVASIGDISELITELKGADELRAEYQLDPKRRQDKQRSAAFVSVAVMLYILCVIPLFIFQSVVGLILMFIFVALATALLIYNGMTKSTYKVYDDTIAEEFKQWRTNGNDRRAAIKSISSALWAVALVVYFLVSFSTGAWHLTWLIFVIAGAVNGVIKAFFDYKK